MRKILTFLGSLLLIHCGARQRQPAAATSSVAYEGRVGSPATAAMAVAVMWCCRVWATWMFLQRPHPVARSPTCPARRSSTAEPKPAHHLRSCRFYGAGASVPHRWPRTSTAGGRGAGHRAGRSTPPGGRTTRSVVDACLRSSVLSATHGRAASRARGPTSNDVINLNETVHESGTTLFIAHRSSVGPQSWCEIHGIPAGTFHVCC